MGYLDDDNSIEKLAKRLKLKPAEADIAINAFRLGAEWAFNQTDLNRGLTVEESEIMEQLKEAAEEGLLKS